MMNSNAHPDRDTLWRVAVGKAIEREIETVVSHLELCETCAREFDSLSLDNDPAVANLLGMAKANSVVRTRSVVADTIPPVGLAGKALFPLGNPHHAVLDDIDRVCQDFATAWRMGDKPGLDEFLAMVPPEARQTLFVKLLNIEITKRRAAGEWPEVDEYLALWPEFASQIRELLSMSTIDYQDQSSVHGELRTPSPAGPFLSNLGEYRLVRQLGKGGMGEVYEAVHLKRGNQVALKMLSKMSGALLHRFKREFRAVTKINHPHLIGLHTLETDSGQWFFTMDLIQGTTFLDYVRPSGVLDEPRLRSALSQLVRGVTALHEEHIIHRDLKPSNVMVTHEGQLVVLDFGLVLEQDSAWMTQSLMSIAGTPNYMAPEQAAGGDVREASDWYAVGVMLYEALSGRLPFGGQMLQVLQDKQRLEAPSLSRDPTIPADLAELCRGLLATDPRNRPSASQIAQAISSSLEPVSEAVTRTETQLVGREPQLAALQEILLAVQKRSEPQIVFVSGRSGEGKTTLVEQFLKPLRKDKRFAIMSGRCYDRESVPFKALDALIDSLGSYLRSLPGEDAALLIPDDISVLAQVFPSLQRVQVIAKALDNRLTGLDRQQVRQRAFRALRSLLSRINRRTQVVWFIDDLQWGDADSAEALFEVLRPPEAPPVLFLGTYRSDEVEDSAFLKKWQELQAKYDVSFADQEIKVAPLTDEECAEVAIQLIGIDDEAIRRQAIEFAREANGNPFLLTELIGCFDSESDTIEPLALHEVLERKLSRLPAEAVQLLEVVAVSGQGLALEEASVTAGHELTPVATITRMCNERLVRLIGSEESPLVDTYHDRIRDAVLRDMNVDSRKSLHVRLAEVIEGSVCSLNEKRPPAQEVFSGDEQTNPRVYDLAYHFYEGGDPRAFDFQLQAGEAATRAYAIENAIEHLLKAEQIMPEAADQQTRYSLWEKLGAACGQTQRFQKALEYFEKALPFANGRIQQAKAHDGIGEMQHRMGKYDPAIASFDRALKALGYHRPNWLPRVLIETTWLLGLCQLMWLVRPCKTKEARGWAKLASSVFQHISEVFLTRDVPRYTDACARVAFAALRSGDPGTLAVGFGKLGYNNALFSLQMPAKWMLARAAKFSKQCGDAPSLAMTEGFIGLSLYCIGRLEEAERRLLKSLEMTSRLGESWYRLTWFHTLRHVYSIQGNYDKEVAAAGMELQIGEAALDPESICWGQYGLAYAKARIGRLPEAHEHMRRSLAAIEGRLSGTEAIAFNHLGFVLLQSSEYSKAAEALEESRRMIEHAFAYVEYLASTYPLLIEALVGPAWRRPRNDADIRRARRLLLKSRFFAWRFPNIKPHSLRVRGRLLCVSGHPDKASRYFQKAIESSRQLGAKYELARGLLDLAAVTDNDSDTFRSEAVAILTRLNAVIPYAEKWQLGGEQHAACVASQLPGQS